MNAGDRFVAIRDINPQAETHLLVLPERHVDSFREVGEFTPDDYRVVVNVGANAGQTVFHPHWHILGGRMRGFRG